ncbi:MAG: hypothetical protein AB7K24_01585 [Gemmataceae bacterium]
MAHDHSHETDAMQRWLTIGSCIGLGTAAISMAARGRLYFLAPAFRLPVLLGGVSLVALALVYAMATWLARRQHSCGRGQADCDHDHGWSPWHYAVLLLPIYIFMLDLPRAGFSAQAMEDFAMALEDVQLERHGSPDPRPGELMRGVGFLQLERAATDQQARSEYAGRVVRVLGQVVEVKRQRQFMLMRLILICCASDARPINILVELPCNLSSLRLSTSDWVEVEGRIVFHFDHARNKHIVGLQVEDVQAVQHVPAPRYPFLTY